jgi:hAT family C-terminal dimerisation region
MPSATIQNEFDRYLLAPPAPHGTKTLEYWRKTGCYEFPHMALMVRDVYAVPASGAGVEREFNKSVKIANPGRANLKAETIEESMMYKPYLARKRKAIREANGKDIEEQIPGSTRGFLKNFNLSSLELHRSFWRFPLALQLI